MQISSSRRRLLAGGPGLAAVIAVPAARAGQTEGDLAQASGFLDRFLG